MYPPQKQSLRYCPLPSLFYGEKMRKPNQTHRTTQERRESANLRQEECNKRTPQQQIQHLDKVLGTGQGATKERARLAKMMEK
jgi:hypothetical protein